MGRTGSFSGTRTGNAPGIGSYTSYSMSTTHTRHVVSIHSPGPRLSQSERSRLDNEFGLLSSYNSDGALGLSGSRYHPEGRQGFSTREILRRYRRFKDS